jgi:hypothetical protein
MPVTAESLANLKSGHDGYQLSAKDAEQSRKNRINPVSDIVAMQAVLKKIVTGHVRWLNGEEVIDIPAREIAAVAKSYQVLEAQRRMNLGKANPAPVKSEPKRKRSGGALRPAFVEQQPVEPPG